MPVTVACHDPVDPTCGAAVCCAGPCHHAGRSGGCKPVKQPCSPQNWLLHRVASTTNSSEISSAAAHSCVAWNVGAGSLHILCKKPSQPRYCWRPPSAITVRSLPPYPTGTSDPHTPWDPPPAAASRTVATLAMVAASLYQRTCRSIPEVIVGPVANSQVDLDSSSRPHAAYTALSALLHQERTCRLPWATMYMTVSSLPWWMSTSPGA